MLEKVDNWLHHGRNYSSGILLYTAIHGQDTFLKIYGSRENEFSKDKLFQKLKSWYDQELEKVAVPHIVREDKSVEKKKKVKPELYSKEDFPDLPEDLQAIASSLSELWAQLNEARHALPWVKNDKERLQLAKRIVLKLEPKIDGIYAELDYWKVHGVMKSASKKHFISPVEELNKMMRKRQTNREYISRNKNRDDQEIKDQVHLRKIENEELTNKINSAVHI